MTNINEIIQELQQLTETTNKDRTKISQIKELLPFIKEAKKSGISHKKIVEVLNAKGIDITLKSYSVMIATIEKQNKRETYGLPKNNNKDEETKTKIENTSGSKKSLVSPFTSPRLHNEKRIDDENSNN
jgi:hypothetical protein